MISDQITAAKFQQWAENEKTLFILDVRSPQEHASGHLGGHLIGLQILIILITDPLSSLGYYWSAR